MVAAENFVFYKITHAINRWKALGTKKPDVILQLCHVTLGRSKIGTICIVKALAFVQV